MSLSLGPDIEKEGESGPLADTGASSKCKASAQPPQQAKEGGGDAPEPEDNLQQDSQVSASHTPSSLPSLFSCPLSSFLSFFFHSFVLSSFRPSSLPLFVCLFLLFLLHSSLSITVSLPALLLLLLLSSAVTKPLQRGSAGFLRHLSEGLELHSDYVDVNFCPAYSMGRVS